MRLPRKIGRAARAFPPGRWSWPAALALIIALTLVAPLSVARAARGNAEVRASLDDTSVDAGQGTQYRISVLNADADEPPAAPVVDGLTFTSAGQTQSQSFNVNGFGSAQLRTTTIYLFNVETLKPGRFTIPGQDVRVGGVNLRTLPVTLTVLGAGGTSTSLPQVYAELVVPKKSAYVGEGVPIEARVYVVSGANLESAPDLILNGDGFSAQKFTRPQPGSQIVNGVRYHVDVYKSSIAGLKLGEVGIGPIEVEPLVQLPNPRQRRRGNVDPFDALLGGQIDVFDLSPPRRMKLDTEVVPLEVKALPEAGKPPDFSGAIGQFKLDAEVTPRQAQTGDPVTVRLRLVGQGNFDRINAPTLTSDEGLRTYPATSRFRANDEVSLSGSKFFEQVVIASSARTTLPGYHFNYFDPSSGKYCALDTGPEAIKIEGPTLATPTPAPVTVLAGAPSPTPASPAPGRDLPADILDIRRDAGARLTSAGFQPLYRRTGFWFAQGSGLAALAVFGVLAALRARRRNPNLRRAAERMRAQSELRRALRRGDTGRQEFYSAATRLAQLRAAPPAAQADPTLSAAEICRLHRLDGRTADSLEEIFHRRDELAYSGEVVAQSPVSPDERRDVLATLEVLDCSRHAVASEPSTSYKSVLHAVLIIGLSLGGAVRVCAAPKDNFTQGNDLYAAGKFSEAAQAYQAQVKQGEFSANLFYNLANAEFRLGDRGRAIINYQRALLLEPAHAEAAANLAFTRGRAPTPTADASSSRLAGAWSVVTDHLGVDSWTWLAVAGAWTALLGAVAAIGFRRQRGSALAFAVAGGATFGLAMAAICSLRDGAKNPARAIVVADSTRALSSPADNAQGGQSLPVGAEVRILSDQGAWNYVQLEGGQRGWVPADRIERVIPPSAPTS